MSLSMYETSIPVFTRLLGNLATILEKGAAYAAAEGLDPAELIGARLAPDMFPLSGQVQSASDAAKGAGARLAGIEVPSFPDTETTFPELQARIAKTVDFLKTITPAQVDGDPARTVTLNMRSGAVNFEARNYLLGFALPNFFFHVTTAYAILRHKGVAVGKMDYLGGV